MLALSLRAAGARASAWALALSMLAGCGTRTQLTTGARADDGVVTTDSGARRDGGSPRDSGIAPIDSGRPRDSAPIDAPFIDGGPPVTDCFVEDPLTLVDGSDDAGTARFPTASFNSDGTFLLVVTRENALWSGTFDARSLVPQRPMTPLVPDHEGGLVRSIEELAGDPIHVMMAPDTSGRLSVLLIGPDGTLIDEPQSDILGTPIAGPGHGSLSFAFTRNGFLAIAAFARDGVPILLWGNPEQNLESFVTMGSDTWVEAVGDEARFSVLPNLVLVDGLAGGGFGEPRSVATEIQVDAARTIARSERSSVVYGGRRVGPGDVREAVLVTQSESVSFTRIIPHTMSVHSVAAAHDPGSRWTVAAGQADQDVALLWENGNVAGGADLPAGDVDSAPAIITPGDGSAYFIVLYDVISPRPALMAARITCL